MRCILILSVVTGIAWSQGLTDAAGVIAGGTAGVGAGKQVSKGITSVLQGVNAATNKAATGQPAKASDKPAGNASGKTSERAANGGGAVLQTAPGGVVKDHSLVPPPPPKKVAVVPAPPPLPVAPAVALPVVALPPPRQVTPDDLNSLASGTPRADLLKLGAPASRITMFDEGHLLEIYQYQSRQSTFGVVRLSDGSVSSVQMR